VAEYESMVCVTDKCQKVVQFELCHTVCVCREKGWFVWSSCVGGARFEIHCGVFMW